MPLILDRDMKDFRDAEKKELDDLREWEKSRIIKKCKGCGRPYSYDRHEIDPKECQRCRGAEGELRFI